MNKYLILSLLSLTLLLAQASAAWAQPATGGPTPAVLPPTNVPLDSSASLLLAGGIGYAVRKLWRRRAS